jgi:hypothetical protein
VRFVGTLALAAVLAACSNAPPAVVRDYTSYSGTVPALDGGRERTARVTLRDDGSAGVQLSSPGPSGDFFGEGKWRQADNGLVIELAGVSPPALVFRRTGDLLIGKEWDRALWGDKEPVLYRVR